MEVLFNMIKTDLLFFLLVFPRSAFILIFETAAEIDGSTETASVADF